MHDNSCKVKYKLTRMTTFINTKLKKQLDNETNIVKYRVTANITEYPTISK